MSPALLNPPFAADSTWASASVPWLLAALVLAAGVAAVGVWTLVARVKELEAATRRFDALGSIESRLQKLVEDRGDLDLRRIEHVLLELRDAARRLEDTLLRATQSTRTPSSGAALSTSAASLSDRVIDRLLAHGYEHVQLVTTLDQLAKIFDAEGAVGEVLVEARHNGVLCKGRVLVRNGAVTEVELKPAYSMFP